VLHIFCSKQQHFILQLSSAHPSANMFLQLCSALGVLLNIKIVEDELYTIIKAYEFMYIVIYSILLILSYTHYYSYPC